MQYKIQYAASVIAFKQLGVNWTYSWKENKLLKLKSPILHHNQLQLKLQLQKTIHTNCPKQAHAPNP